MRQAGRGAQLGRRPALLPLCQRQGRPGPPHAPAAAHRGLRTCCKAPRLLPKLLRRAGEAALLAADQAGHTARNARPGRHAAADRAAGGAPGRARVLCRSLARRGARWGRRGRWGCVGLGAWCCSWPGRLGVSRLASAAADARVAAWQKLRRQSRSHFHSTLGSSPSSSPRATSRPCSLSSPPDLARLPDGVCTAPHAPPINWSDPQYGRRREAPLGAHPQAGV